MAALQRSKGVEVFWAVHKFVLQLTGGRIGGRVVGMPVLMLTTKGRKSGQPRTSPLTYLEDGESLVVMASCLGQEKHPAWYLNLVADPHVDVEIRGTIRSMMARTAEGDERSRLWQAACSANSDYQEYQERTAREIPVVVLDPV